MDVYQSAFEWTDTSRMWLIETPIRIAAYCAVALIVRVVAHRIIDRATRRPIRPGGDTAIRARRAQRAQTIGSVVKSTISIVLLVWVVLSVLSAIGVNIAPFIASAGIIGLAIGFGAQNLVRDFVSGVFMLLEDQYGVGDIVDLGEAVGEIESVGLRITTLRDVDGTLWYVRNGEIARVGNMSQEYAVARVEVPVAHSANIDAAERVALRAAEDVVADPEVADDVLGSPEMLGVQEVGADRVLLRMTLRTRPNAQWALQRRIRRAVLQAYEREEIALPYRYGIPGGMTVDASA